MVAASAADDIPVVGTVVAVLAVAVDTVGTLERRQV